MRGTFKYLKQRLCFTYEYFVLISLFYTFSYIAWSLNVVYNTRCMVVVLCFMSVNFGKYSLKKNN